MSNEKAGPSFPNDLSSSKNQNKTKQLNAKRPKALQEKRIESVEKLLQISKIDSADVEYIRNNKQDTVKTPIQTEKNSRTNPKVNFTENTHDFKVQIIPPDGGWGWMVVLAAFIIFFVTDGSILAFGLFLEDMANEFDCKKSEITNANAIKIAVFCFQGPVSAALVNKWGFKIVALIGIFIGILAHVATALSPNLLVVILSIGVVGGIGSGMVYMSALIALGYYFEKWRSLASGLAACGSGLSTVIMPIVITYTKQRMGWRNTYYMLAVLTGVGIPASFALRQLHTIVINSNKSTVSRMTLKSSIFSNKTNSSVSDNFFQKYHNKNYSVLSAVQSESLIEIMYRDSSIKKFDVNSKEKNDRNYEIASNLTNMSKRRTASSINTTKKSLCCKFRKRKISYTRPMYRDDILSNRILINNKVSSLQDYRLETTRVMTEQDVRDDLTCNLCPESVKRVLATMLDFRLLKNASFLLISLHQLFLSMGYYIPFMFILDRGIKHGLDKQKIVALISILGITNCIGRAICGIVVSISVVKPLPLTYISLTIAGIFTIISGLSYKIWYQYFYVSVYGFAVASSSTLRSVLIIETVGLENLTNGTGLNFIFRGFGDLIGLVLGGYFVNWTDSYNVTFYFSGSLIVVAAFFTLLCEIAIARNKVKRVLKQ